MIPPGQPPRVSWPRRRKRNSGGNAVHGGVDTEQYRSRAARGIVMIIRSDSLEEEEGWMPVVERPSLFRMVSPVPLRPTTQFLYGAVSMPPPSTTQVQRQFVVPIVYLRLHSSGLTNSLHHGNVDDDRRGELSGCGCKNPQQPCRLWTARWRERGPIIQPHIVQYAPDDRTIVYHKKKPG